MSASHIVFVKVSGAGFYEMMLHLPAVSHTWFSLRLSHHLFMGSVLPSAQGPHSQESDSKWGLWNTSPGWGLTDLRRCQLVSTRAMLTVSPWVLFLKMSGVYTVIWPEVLQFMYLICKNERQRVLSIFIASSSRWTGVLRSSIFRSDSTVLTTVFLTCRLQGTLLSILVTDVTFDMFWFR